MQKLNLLVVIGMIFLFMEYAAAKETSKGNFSFAEIDWNDNVETVKKKVEQTGMFGGVWHSSQVADNDWIFLPNDDYFEKKKKECNMYNLGVGNSEFAEKYRLVKHETIRIRLVFSDVTQKLIYYEVKDSAPTLIDTLTKKYGKPSTTYGDQKWKGTGQSLYFSWRMDRVLYVSTTNLDEYCAIVQKKIKEMRELEKNKNEKLF